MWTSEALFALVNHLTGLLYDRGQHPREPTWPCGRGIGRTTFYFDFWTHFRRVFCFWKHDQTGNMTSRPRDLPTPTWKSSMMIVHGKSSLFSGPGALLQGSACFFGWILIDFLEKLFEQSWKTSNAEPKHLENRKWIDRAVRICDPESVQKADKAFKLFWLSYEEKYKIRTFCFSHLFFDPCPTPKLLTGPT